MIDITDALAGIVSDFESMLDELRDEADAAREEVEEQTSGQGAELRVPAQIYLTESDFDEDDVYRWQRWRR
ncbi:hypothetical protein BST43_13225 [Mycobacteroides saopaulense]|uniref:Uncharacterized protein n=1 Tax=Mycobacteroides saopaulense TaxID=1578165 RepID=A0A1S4VXY4_9MYCO|nr:hypothetical protein [Mycobacteroides saopaulense]ALR12863.1 hypothetical protein MYCSP_17280 [Mycobacteroides saopaulense]ORB56746.1 hypothetical protein BST43_13225 [Mycobacteroides saopaulense]